MYIGIDLGGTNIAVGLVTPDARIISQASAPTNAPRSAAEIAEDMAVLCKKVVSDGGYSMNDIKHIGIGSPGAVDSKNGLVLYSCNLDWHSAPIVAELKKHFPEISISVENDANTAAYGEYIVNGDGVDSFVAVTLGTGVGGGIILNKKIYRGFAGAGGEIGHFTLVHDGEPCTCGNKGCWECYASVTALVRQTKAAIEKHPESLMAEYAEKKGKLNGKIPFDAAKAGDPAAKEVVSKYLTYIADGITGVVNMLQPEIVVIGGGISREGDYLLNPVKDYLKKHIYCKVGPQPTLKIATLFNDAGIIGAALAGIAEK